MLEGEGFITSQEERSWAAREGDFIARGQLTQTDGKAAVHEAEIRLAVPFARVNLDIEIGGCAQTPRGLHTGPRARAPRTLWDDGLAVRHDVLSDAAVQFLAGLRVL